MKTVYSEETKKEAVAMVIEDGLSKNNVAKKFNVSRQTIHTWVKEHIEEQELINNPKLVEANKRIEKLERELYLSNMERDILKKAQVYLKKKAQTSTP